VELLLSIEIVKEMTFIDRQLVPKRGVGPGGKMGENGTDERRVDLMRMIAVPIDVHEIIGAVVRSKPCFGDSSAVAKAKVVTYVVLDDVRESRLLLALALSSFVTQDKSESSAFSDHRWKHVIVHRMRS
jgi:hypothetical protein